MVLQYGHTVSNFVEKYGQSRTFTSLPRKGAAREFHYNGISSPASHVSLSFDTANQQSYSATALLVLHGSVAYGRYALQCLYPQPFRRVAHLIQTGAAACPLCCTHEGTVHSRRKQGNYHPRCNLLACAQCWPRLEQNTENYKTL